MSLDRTEIFFHFYTYANEIFKAGTNKFAKISNGCKMWNAFYFTGYVRLKFIMPFKAITLVNCNCPKFTKAKRYLFG